MGEIHPHGGPSLPLPAFLARRETFPNSTVRDSFCSPPPESTLAMGCRQSTPVESLASSSHVNANTSAPLSQAPVSAPASAPVSAPRSNVSDLPNAAPISPASKTPIAKAETAPKSALTPVPNPKSSWRFAITGYSILESGVVYYAVELEDGADGATVQKRFREFKALYQALTKKEGGAALPALPDSGVRSVLKGRHNSELIRAREVQLAAVLNAIADRPTLAASTEFRQFVAPASA
jgi:hypothetical protein